MSAHRLPLASLLASASLLSLGVVGAAACAKDATTGNTSGNEAGDEAAGVGDAAEAADSGDAGADLVCAFNRECSASQRCECSETAGCACKPGARGTGRNGIDPCTDGNACASSVCTEGPPDSGSFCSGECTSSTDCTGTLPVCADIALVGRICIRQAPN